MKRTEFIRRDEFLIIHAAADLKLGDLGTVPFVPEVNCERTWSIDEVLTEVIQNDICHAIYRAGPEGFEDISEELAKHYVRANDIIAQSQVPDTWHWLFNSSAVQSLPEDEIYTDPNADHRRDYYASVL